MMSTPAATRVDSVREKRASAIFRTTSPIFIGTRSLKRSHSWRPRSVRFSAPEHECSRRRAAGKMMNHQSRSAFEAATTIFVGAGSSPPSSSKTFAKTGTMKRSMKMRTSVAKREDDDRIDHRALHAPLDLRLLLDLGRHAVEHLVERARGLAGLDHGDEEPVEHLRMPSERRRERHPTLDVGAQLAMISARYLSSVCSSRITRAWTTLTPASIIVANCRAKICSDFGLTFLNLTVSAALVGGALLGRATAAAGRASGAARARRPGRARGSRR